MIGEGREARGGGGEGNKRTRRGGKVSFLLLAYPPLADPYTGGESVHLLARPGMAYLCPLIPHLRRLAANNQVCVGLSGGMRSVRCTLRGLEATTARGREENPRNMTKVLRPFISSELTDSISYKHDARGGKD